MSRKRPYSSRRPRNSPGSERSYYEYLVSTPAPAITRTELVRLVRGGEDTYLELKVRFSNVEKLTAEIIALANTGGGAIIFGVNDQLRIEGVDDPESVETQLRELCSTQIQPRVFPFINKVAFDNGRRIVVLEVETGERPHRTLDDRFYLRDGSTKREATREELSILYQESFLTRFEQVPLLNAWIDQDIDESLFWSFVRGVAPGQWGESQKGFPTEAVLRDLGLAIKLGEESIPTVAALLLFGRNERLGEIFPRAALTLTRFGGSNIRSPLIEQQLVKGNLLAQYDASVGFIQRYADLWEQRPSKRALSNLSESLPADHFERGRSNYSRLAVIECLLNLLAHRDWSARDEDARINVFDDSIELINPAVRSDLPASAIPYGVQSPANLRLKSILTNLHYGVSQSAGGLPMVLAESQSFARRAPEGPLIINGEFHIKLFGF
jgi:ATP-dependent DNA helicase RecG